MFLIEIPDPDKEHKHFVNPDHIIRITTSKDGEAARVHLSDGNEIVVNQKVAEIVMRDLKR